MRKHQKKISTIFLSGGKGLRMKTKTPKQYLKIKNKEIALYSFEKFLSIEEIDEIIVVCEEKYKNIFLQCFEQKSNREKKLLFARPGTRRQDSVYNGLRKASNEIICIHDGARPFFSKKDLFHILKDIEKDQAATTGKKVKNTIKAVSEDGSFIKTLDRSFLYEIYTPQILLKDVLIKGYKEINENNIQVTDDLSIAELINIKPKIIDSSIENIKVTTKIDLKLIEHFLKDYEKEI